MSKQLTLDLALPESYSQADYILHSGNHAAYQAVMNWPAWEVPVFGLYGDNDTGKSHLAAIWSEKSGAISLNSYSLEINSLFNSETTAALLLEDANENLNQTAFFHLLNFVKEMKISLLITSLTPATQWAIALPDLASRLRSIPFYLLNSPDDQGMKKIYLKLFTDYQLEIDTGLIDYLLIHSERSLAKAKKVVETLDQLSLEKKRKITRILATEALGLIE